MAARFMATVATARAVTRKPPMVDAVETPARLVKAALAVTATSDSTASTACFPVLMEPREPPAATAATVVLVVRAQAMVATVAPAVAVATVEMALRAITPSLRQAMVSPVVTAVAVAPAGTVAPAGKRLTDSPVSAALLATAATPGTEPLAAMVSPE